MNQGDDRTRAETPAHPGELPRDICTHKNRRHRHRQKAIDTQVMADLGTDSFNPQHMSLVAGAVVFVERTLDSGTNTTNAFDLLEPHQELILAFGAEVLHGNFAQLKRCQSMPDLITCSRFIESYLHNAATSEIDSVI